VNVVILKWKTFELHCTGRHTLSFVVCSDYYQYSMLRKYQVMHIAFQKQINILYSYLYRGTGSVKIKPASSLAVSLGKAFNKISSTFGWLDW